MTRPVPGIFGSNVADQEMSRAVLLRCEGDIGSVVTDGKAREDGVPEVVRRLPRDHLLGRPDPVAGESAHGPHAVGGAGSPTRTRSDRVRNDHSFHRPASPIRGQTSETGAELRARVVDRPSSTGHGWRAGGRSRHSSTWFFRASSACW